jgi:hypothetical protein
MFGSPQTLRVGWMTRDENATVRQARDGQAMGDRAVLLLHSIVSHCLEHVGSREGIWGVYCSMPTCYIAA